MAHEEDECPLAVLAGGDRLQLLPLTMVLLVEVLWRKDRLPLDVLMEFCGAVIPFPGFSHSSSFSSRASTHFQVPSSLDGQIMKGTRRMNFKKYIRNLEKYNNEQNYMSMDAFWSFISKNYLK